LKHEAIAHQEYLHYLDQKLKFVEISSPDWRTIFAKKFRPQFICRSIIFSGFFFKFPNLKIRQKCNECLSAFVSKFGNLTPIWEEFIQIFRPGKYFCAFDAANACVCYSEIMAMCESEADIGVETVDYLFANKSPIHQFTISKIDQLAM
jgi:hypothetical protein